MSTADGAVVGTAKIVDHGPDNQRWNLVILSDGYRAAELGQFAGDAQGFVNTLFSQPPFDELQGVINVHRIDVASTDSGADDPVMCRGTGTTAATYFDASFCNNGLRRRLEVNDETVVAVAGAQVPGWHMALVLVNSVIPGGRGGAVAGASLGVGAADTAIHELGHTAFGLADEYEYYAECGIDTDRNHHPAVEPAAPNVTIESNQLFIKWREFIERATPVPTTSNPNCAECDPQPSPVPAGTVGAFEGAHQYHCGAYRPEFDCRMRHVNAPYCAVCQQVIRNHLAAYVFPGSVSGTPGLGPARRGRGNTGLGTLEVVTPMQRGGLGNYWRDNNAPGMPWNGPVVFARDVGQFDDVTLHVATNVLEVVARFGGRLLHYQRDLDPPFQWHGPLLLSGNEIVSGNPCLITGIRNLGVLLTQELVVPLASVGIAHYWRDARSDTITWHGPTIFAQELGHVDAVSLIQSSVGDPGGGNTPTNLEVVARWGNQLFHYWRDAGPAFHWNGPFPIGHGQPGVAGNPSLLQVPFGLPPKNFELVVPLASGGIAHYWRDNNAPGMPWNAPVVFGTDIGRFEALAMVIDAYTRWLTPPFTLQVVARFQNKLLFYYRDPGPAFRWTLL